MLGLLGCDTSDDDPVSGAGGAGGGGLVPGGSGGASSGTQVEGAPVAKSIAWRAGKGLRIHVEGGEIRSGFASTSIAVVGGGEPGKVAVTFRPFEDSGLPSGADPAKNLELAVAETEDEVQVTVKDTGTDKSSRSARVDLTLPGDFAGALVAESDAGSVSIEGVNGPVTVETTGGSVSVSGAIHNLSVLTTGGDITALLAEPALAGDTGLLRTDRNISLGLPKASSVALAAQAGQSVTFSPDPLPKGWQATDSGNAAKYLAGNDGSTRPWALESGRPSSSRITVAVR